MTSNLFAGHKKTDFLYKSIIRKIKNIMRLIDKNYTKSQKLNHWI